MTIRRLCAHALPFVIVLTACTTPTDEDTEEDETPAQAVYRIRGSDMGRTWQNIQLQRDGALLAGAQVRVNGTRIPDLAGQPGYYYGDVPVVDPGDVLELEVRSGDDLVQATGVVPAAPVLSSPLDGAVFVKGTPVHVQWTSTSDPDRFTVWASWSCGTNCGTGATWDVQGTARTFTIPAADLPDDTPVTIEVTGYNDGVFTGPVTEDSGMSIRGEGPSESVITMSSVVYRIAGSDMSGVWQNVFVYRNDVLLSGVNVQVNGVALSEVQTGLYSGQVPQVPVGDLVWLNVRNGAEEVNAAGRVPDAAALTAPANGSVFSQSAQITVTWTSPTSPQWFKVYAHYSCGTNCGTAKAYEVLGTARSVTFAAADLPANEPVTIEVMAYNDGEFNGPVSLDSRMRIRADPLLRAVITITP